MFIDTHAHLTDERYQDVDALISDLEKNNVSKVFCVSYNYETIVKSFELSQKYPNVYCILGVHPSDSASFNSRVINFLRKHVSNPKVLAIGEIGLDYHYPDTNKEVQKRVFVEQLQLADKLSLPVVLHNRDSISDMISILKEHKHLLNNGMLLHCFSETEKSFHDADGLIDMISVGGAITFKNATELQQTIRNIPLSRIILETDCPYLTPHPLRGRAINEPKYVNLVGEKLAELKEVSLKEIERITNENVYKFFKKLK